MQNELLISTIMSTVSNRKWKCSDGGLNKRAKNELKITVPDSLIANLSIAVTDAGIGIDSSTNIISHLMLSSELKGEIYNPAYYFSNRNAKYCRSP